MLEPEPEPSSVDPREPTEPVDSLVEPVPRLPKSTPAFPTPTMRLPSSKLPVTRSAIGTGSPESYVVSALAGAARASPMSGETANAIAAVRTDFFMAFFRFELVARAGDQVLFSPKERMAENDNKTITLGEDNYCRLWWTGHISLTPCSALNLPLIFL